MIHSSICLVSVLASATIFIWSLWAIISEKSEIGWFAKINLIFITGISFIVLCMSLVGYYRYSPYDIPLVALIALISIHCARDFFLKTVWPHKNVTEEKGGE